MSDVLLAVLYNIFAFTESKSSFTKSVSVQVLSNQNAGKAIFWDVSEDVILFKVLPGRETTKLVTETWDDMDGVEFFIGISFMRIQFKVELKSEVKILSFNC